MPESGVRSLGRSSSKPTEAREPVSTKRCFNNDVKKSTLRTMKDFGAAMRQIVPEIRFLGKNHWDQWINLDQFVKALRNTIPMNVEASMIMTAIADSRAPNDLNVSDTLRNGKLFNVDDIEAALALLIDDCDPLTMHMEYVQEVQVESNPDARLVRMANILSERMDEAYGPNSTDDKEFMNGVSLMAKKPEDVRRELHTQITREYDDPMQRRKQFERVRLTHRLGRIAKAAGKTRLPIAAIGARPQAAPKRPQAGSMQQHSNRINRKKPDVERTYQHGVRAGFKPDRAAMARALAEGNCMICTGKGEPAHPHRSLGRACWWRSPLTRDKKVVGAVCTTMEMVENANLCFDISLRDGTKRKTLLDGGAGANVIHPSAVDMKSMSKRPIDAIAVALPGGAVQRNYVVEVTFAIEGSGSFTEAFIVTEEDTPLPAPVLLGAKFMLLRRASLHHMIEPKPHLRVRAFDDNESPIEFTATASTKAAVSTSSSVAAVGLIAPSRYEEVDPPDDITEIMDIGSVKEMIDDLTGGPKKCIRLAHAKPVAQPSLQPELAAIATNPTAFREMMMSGQAELHEKHRNVEECTKEVWQALLDEYPTVTGTAEPTDQTLPIPMIITRIPGAIVPETARIFRLPYDARLRMEKKIEKFAADKICEVTPPNAYGIEGSAFLVSKQDGDDRVLVAHGKANEIIQNDTYPIPAAVTTLEKMSRWKFIATLDLRAAFYQIEVPEESRWATMFVFLDSKNNVRRYRFCRASMGLKVSPAALARNVDFILKPLMMEGCVGTFFDDVTIGGETIEECLANTRRVLELFQKHGGRVKREKGQKPSTCAMVLGLLIGNHVLSSDLDKVAAIKSLKPPSSKNEAKTLLGMLNFLAPAVPQMGDLVAPISDLTKAATNFKWTRALDHTFREIKKRIATHTATVTFVETAEHAMWTDASTLSIAGALLQRVNGGPWQPVMFYATKHTPARHNWAIHELEIFAIVRCYTVFYPYIGMRPITVFTDSKPATQMLKRSTRDTSARAKRWINFLSTNSISLVWLEGSKNFLADYLSRNADVIDPSLEDDSTPNLPMIVPAITQVNYPDARNEVLPGTASDLLADHLAGSAQRIIATYDGDDWANTVIEAVSENLAQEHASLRPFAFGPDGILYFGADARIYIGNGDGGVLRNTILQQYHDAAVAAHPGSKAMRMTIARRFFWNKIDNDIEKYVASCDTCRTRKHQPAVAKSFGTLEIPARPGLVWSMDYAGPLHGIDERFNMVLIGIDDFSHFMVVVPLSRNVTALDTAYAVFDRIVCPYGAPAKIRTDNATLFTATTFEEVLNTVGITRIPILEYSPTSNGRAERAVRIIKEKLRLLCPRPEDFPRAAQAAAYAHNNAASRTLGGATPFQLMLGHNPSDAHLFDHRLADTVHSTRVAEMRDIWRIVYDEYVTSASKKLAKTMEARIKLFNKDDIVYVKRNPYQLSQSSFDTPNVLRALYMGPFVIDKVISSSVYKVSLLSDPTQVRNCHVLRLRRARLRHPDSQLGGRNYNQIGQNQAEQSEYMADPDDPDFALYRSLMGDEDYSDDPDYDSDR